MATPQALSVRLIWTLGGGDWAVNSLYYRRTGATPWDQGKSDEVAAGIDEAWTSSGLLVNMPTVLSLNRIETRDINTDGNPVFTSTLTVTGTNANDMLPRQTCVVTTLRTAFVARRGRGRIYHPPGTSGILAPQGTVDSANAALYNAVVDGYRVIEIAGEDPMPLTVFSRMDNILRNVTSHDTDLDFDVQVRRRDIGV